MRDIRSLAQEAGLSEQTVAFVEWLDAQHPAMFLRVLAYVDIVTRSRTGDLDIPIDKELAVPNVWAGGDAAARLRDLALSAGVPEVAEEFGAIAQKAAEVIQEIETVPYPVH